MQLDRCSPAPLRFATWNTLDLEHRWSLFLAGDAEVPCFLEEAIRPLEPQASA
jgi:hypothetical protein